MNYTLSEDVLLEEAIALAEKAHLLDPYTVTAFHEILTNLPGANAVAEAVIDQWIEKFKAENHEDVNLENHFNQKIHPRIETEFSSVKEKAQANVGSRCMSLYSQKKRLGNPRGNSNEVCNHREYGEDHPHL